MPTDIEEALSRGATILTGNQRAARTLSLDFDRQRRMYGLASWRPPSIFAWDTWLGALWHEILVEGHSDRLLLNRTQELSLWRSIIAADSDSGLNSGSDAQWSSLQSVDSLAKLAAEAWQRLCSYSGQNRLRSLGVSGDTRAFQRWAEAFTRRCQTDLYISASELERVTASAVSKSGFKPTANELVLIGFDVLTPALQALLEDLREAGISISHRELPHVANDSYLATAKNLDDELDQAAHWLRQTLIESPEARIAVIHPDIASERDELDRVFRQVLAPDLQYIAADPATAPYEFSLGQPLSRQPMIAVALRLLRWTITALPMDEISHLLLSPFFTARGPERPYRAEFDAFRLRPSTLLRPELDLSSFIAQVEDDPRRANSLSGLLKQLHDLRRTASKILSDSKQKSFTDWADNIRDLLYSAAWASASPDTSIEFQTRRKWENALDELATLDFQGTRATLLEALDHIEQIAQRTLFAPESDDAPIQIMSPQEAAGSLFDAVYFLRGSDLNWPVRPSMNPLLGWRIQRELHMPGSDAAQDANYFRRIAARLGASAPTVIFSYASETSDAHQRLSPILADLSLKPLAATQAPERAAVIELETLEDSSHIPLRNPRVQGGSSVLQLQAACGFRAFAEKRLWSSALESREPGMNARERGNIIHLALQQLWKNLGTQAKLRSLTFEERAVALSFAIDHSFTSSHLAPSSAWESAYLKLQRERLQRLLSAWLDFELTRSPFEVKLREQEYEDAAIGPLLLSLRVDRVDRVFNQEGEELGDVILDYKTGASSPSDWQTDRPDEPQLPLYAALREPGTVAAISFAGLRPGKDMGLQGLAAGEGILPNRGTLKFSTFEDQIAEWHRILTRLANEFVDGDVRVRPKAYPRTCEFCKQRILCRLDPTTLEEIAEEADEPDA